MCPLAPRGALFLWPRLVGKNKDKDVAWPQGRRLTKDLGKGSLVPPQEPGSIWQHWPFSLVAAEKAAGPSDSAPALCSGPDHLLVLWPVRGPSSANPANVQGQRGRSLLSTLKSLIFVCGCVLCAFGQIAPRLGSSEMSG